MFSRGGSSRGARGGFGTRDAGSFNKAAPPQSTAENDDWDEGSAPTPVKKPDAAVQENGGSNRGRFGGAQENGSAGFQRGAAGQDFGDKQQSNGFSNNNGGGFGSGGFKQNNETNGGDGRGVASGGNSTSFQTGRGSFFGANRGGTASAGRDDAGNNNASTNSDEPARRGFGARGGFGGRGGGSSGDSRPAFGGNRNEGSNEQGGSQPNGFGGPRAAGGRFGNNTENSAANENGESNEGGAARGGGAFGRSAFGNRFAENSDAAPSRYANSNNCHNCNKPGHMSRECTEPKAPRQNGFNGGGGGGGGDTKCFNCQGTGHMSRECTEPKQERPPREGAERRPPQSCYNCGESGHMSRECTQPKTGGGGDRPGFGAGNAASAAFDSNYTDDKPSHVPVMRTIENIFEEDEKMCEKYSTIRIEDDEITISGQGDEAPTMIEAWADGNLQESLLANINRAKYVLPRKIQSYTIPLIMDGYDVKGHAETGSGKTAAFLIPIIDTIIKKKAAEEMKSERSKPIALIIEPTRELAIQLHDQARKLAEGTGVSVAVAYGKYQYRDNLRHVSMGCDILVGTPGRLKDFILKRYVMVENLKYLVIDEADELLEDQFMRDIRDISNVEKFPKKEDRQTLLFSATFPEEIQEWANEWMRPKNVMVSNKKLTTANHRVRQDFHLVAESEKKTKLLEMLNEELAELKKAEPDNEDLKLRKTLIFVKLKRTCDVLCSYLQQNKFTSTTINGDRTQEQRENCLNQLRNGEVQVVVTTDVCARGIDIKNLDHVINMDLPETYVSYIHRIGRTARLKEGTATSFFDPLADMDLAGPLVKGIKEVGQEVPEFLEKAADGTLEYQPPPQEDCEFGANSVPVGGAGFGATFGKTGGEAAAAAPAAPAADNDDWDDE